MGGLDSHKGSEKPKAGPNISDQCSEARREMGMTPAEGLCVPRKPIQPAQTERQKVDEYFRKMEQEFDALGIKLPVDFYKGGYYTLVSKEKRPPIELVYSRIKIFFTKAKESTLAATIIHDRSKDLLEILQLHLLGRDQEANDLEIELFSNIDAKILRNSIEKIIGTKFNNDQAKEFSSQLLANNITLKIAVKLIGQIKKLSPEDFKSLKLSKDLLISNLVALIVILREVGVKAKDYVKAQLNIRARFTRKYTANKREIEKNKTVVKKFGKRIARYKKENPGVELDETLAKYEATMVDAAHNVVYYEMLQMLESTKSELAFSYLNKLGKALDYTKAKTAIEEMFQSKDSKSIKSLSSKYKVALPATINSLQTAESNFETKSVDEYIARETGNSPYARQAYDQFYKTGKVEGSDKTAILNRLAFESSKLIDISDKLADKIDAEATYFEKLLQKYQDISQVPAKEKRATALRLQGYIQLLNQYASMQGRLLSIAATYDLMGTRPEKKPEDTEKRSWETVVAEVRQEAENSNNEAKIVASFLDIKGYEGQDINQASLSRLTLTLIQKENAGLEAKYKGVMDNVSNDYGTLGNIMDQFEKAQADPDWAEEHGTKLVRIFNQGSEAYAKMIPSIEVARGRFKEMKSDLSLALFSIQHGDSPLLKLHPQLRDVYAMVLENAIKSVDQVLDNPNSPISTQQLEKLKLAQRNFEKAKEDFLNGVLKNIAVFTIIMATSIMGGIAGSYLITGVLRTSSIFLVPIGTSAGGVIGSRIGMSLTNATGLSNFENIWDPKQMGKDFVYGYGLSLGALMTAKGAIGALKVASHSRNARVATGAARMLNTIQKAKALTSPFELHNVRTSLAKFGAKVGEEFAEETIEEGVGQIGQRINNPYLEFFVSVINSSDGMNVKLNMAGVNTKKVGLSTEGNKLTYTTKTPLEFIANLKAQFAGKKGSSFDAKINPDGTIGISIYGKTLHQSIATLTIHPSTKVATDSKAVEAKSSRKQGRARNLAGKISNSEIGETAMEIIDELFGETVKKSKTAFLKTVAKFKTIGVYLKTNAKELATIFDAKFKEQGVAFGMSGTQVLQILYETVAKFTKKKGTVSLYTEVAKLNDGAELVHIIDDIRSLYGKDVKAFNRFSSLVAGINPKYLGFVLSFIESGRPIYENNIPMLEAYVQFLAGRTAVDSGDYENRSRINITAEDIRYLISAKEVYGDNLEMFKVFLEVSSKYGGIKELYIVRVAYKENTEMFLSFAKIIKNHGVNVARKLASDGMLVFGNDIEIFREYVRIISMSGQSIENAYRNIGVLSLALKLHSSLNNVPFSLNYDHALFDILHSGYKLIGDEHAFIEEYLVFREKHKGEQREEAILKSYLKTRVFSDRGWDLGKIYSDLKKLFPEYDLSGGITEDNWQFVLVAYCHVDEMNEASEFDNQVQALMDSSKNLILERLIGLRDRVLAKGWEGLTPLEANLLTFLHGVPNYKMIDSTVKFISNLNPSEAGHADSFKTIREKSQSLLRKFAQRDRTNQGKNINYTHADIASFYEKFGVIRCDTNLLLSTMSTFDALQVDRENYALMQSGIIQGITSLIAIASGNVQTHMPRIQSMMDNLAVKISGTDDVAQQRAILQECNTQITQMLSSFFEQEMGLRNLPPVTAEMMEKITPFITYLTNIAKVSQEKRLILSFFISLQIFGKWDAFKQGEEIDLSTHFSDDNVAQLQAYLSKRTAYDIFAGFDQSFFAKLNESTEAVMVGESGGIVGTLGEIDRHSADLKDPDNFSETERHLFAVVQRFGPKKVGKALSMRFKDASYSDEVIEALGHIDNEKETLPTLQKVARIFGSLLKFQETIEAADIDGHVRRLENALTPSSQVIAVFQKIDVEMSGNSGAKPISDDIEYLESILNKKRSEITEEEYNTAKGYLDGVRKTTMELYVVKDTITKEFSLLDEASKKTSELSDIFKSRLSTFRKILVVEAGDKAITLRSTMTGNLNDVIAHIRQCLGCKEKEVNNDTNLTFGDRNRFFIVTREFSMNPSQSLSDELVTVLETKEENGEKKLSFVMDNVYGARSPDILVTNVLAVLRKLKSIRNVAGSRSIDIFVTDAALNSCGLTLQHLQEKIQKEFGKALLSETIKAVTVAPSASGDGHYEIGGVFNGRVSAVTGFDGKAEGVTGNIRGIAISLPTEGKVEPTTNVEGGEVVSKAEIPVDVSDQFLDLDLLRKDYARYFSGDFEAEVAVPYRAKMAQLIEIKNKAKNLSPVFRDKVNAYVDGKIKSLNDELQRGISKGDRRRIDVALKKVDSYKEVDRLFTSHESSSGIRSEINKLPEPAKRYLEKHLAESERKSSIHPSSISLSITESLVQYATQDPVFFAYAIDKIGHLEMYPALLDSLKDYKQKAEELDSVLRDAVEKKKILEKYPSFDQESNFFSALKDFQEIPAKLKETKTYSEAEELFRSNSLPLVKTDAYGSGHYMDAYNSRISLKLENISRFDSEISARVSARDLPEVLSIFNKLVVQEQRRYSYRKEPISFDEFKNRFSNYEASVKKFSSLDVFKVEGGREVFAKNSRESLENFLIQEILEEGFDPKEVESSVLAEYEKVKSSASVTINVHSDALIKIYEEGEYKVYEELTDRHRDDKNEVYLKARKEADKKISHERRFVVGALASKNGYDEVIGPAPFYGHGVITLKADPIKGRVSFFEGDSMSTSTDTRGAEVMPRWFFRKLANVESRRLDFDSAVFSKALMESYLHRRNLTHIHTLYIEAHVLAPVLAKDFESVTYGISETAPSQKYEQLRVLAEQEGVVEPGGELEPARMEALAKKHQIVLAERRVQLEDSARKMKESRPDAPALQILQFTGDIRTVDLSGMAAGSAKESLEGYRRF
ncbi:MAG: hypothetical protein Q8P62_01395 [Candidatus Peregrinibacteria bacterium]|nr:hypothetical protein [Candidatus Peregrinibacteria bacterium]